MPETSQTGDWFYEISEKAGTNENYSYDSSVYRLDVHAADQDGQIVLNTKLTKDGQPAEAIVFTNTYAPTSVSVTFVVEKALEGNPSEAADFAFLLEGQDVPMPEQNRLVIHGAGQGSFDLVTFNEPGEYKYTIREEEGKDQNYVYDSKPVTVKVSVTDHDGQLEAKMTCIKDDKESDTIRFVNRFASKADSGTETPTRKQPSAPDTGSSSHVLPYSSIMIASITAAAGLLHYGKCRKDEESSD